MSGIYVASKSKHGPMWQRWRELGYPVVSTWIDESKPGQTEDWQDLWLRCVQEASDCTSLILYMEPGEELKGALVEAGCALGNNKPVFYVGPQEAYSILNHPGIAHCQSLGEAFGRAIGRQLGEV